MLTIMLLLTVIVATLAALFVGGFIGTLLVGLVWPEGEIGIMAIGGMIGVACAVATFIVMFTWAVNYG